VYAGTVASTGQATGSAGATHLLSASVIAAPMVGKDIGCPLLDRGGQVAGLLEWTGPPGGATSAVFLPAEVVLGVAQQLVTSGVMDHGWLGVETSDAGIHDPVTTQPATVAGTPPGDGARLDAVDQNSPAAAVGLQAGDVVVGIDGNPVHSKSELDARLYPDTPGTAVNLSLVRAGTTMTLPVVLADGDTDASGGESSP
jgi:serine protease Do